MPFRYYDITKSGKELAMTETATEELLKVLTDVFYFIGDSDEHIEEESVLFKFLTNMGATKREDLRKGIVDLNIEIVLKSFGEVTEFFGRRVGDKFIVDDDTLSEYLIEYMTFLFEKLLSDYGWKRGTNYFPS